jgi:adenylate kinase
MKVLMLAPPGGGKGTQGVRIAEELAIDHISSGDMLRAAVAADTPVGRQVAEYMAAGRLAPDDVVTAAVTEALEDREGYVLDGYPRTLAQAEGLEFDVVFYLDVPDAVITERLLARGRADDSEEVILERIRQYESDTAPLIEYYEDLGVLVRIDGDRPMDEVTAELLENLAIPD